MRAAWRQSCRPKLSSRASARESVLCRGATTNPLRYRPGFSDFFTVFLAPVLAGATLANLSWKEKQKKDWEKRFAEIDREIELLRAREQETWARIQVQSIRSGIVHQRRCYSTAAAVAAVEPHRPYNEASERTFERYDELNPLPLEHDEMSVQQEERAPSDDIDGTPPSPIEDPTLLRFERLIAYRLALQMLLQVHIGGNPKYGEIYQSDYVEDNQLPWDVTMMVRRLREVTSELASMKSDSPEKLRPRPSNVRSPSLKLTRLNNQLHHLGNQYKAGGLKIEGLIERFATIIMSTPAAPDIRTYTSLIHLFNYVEKEDLSYLVLSALRDSSLFLDKIAVHTILWRYGRNRDLQRFDLFLRDLTKTNGRVQDPWEWRRVDGNLIPVPSTFSSLICARLIAVALTCEQTDRAEAWATLMAEERPLHIRLLMVMKHFLQYYRSHLNWEKGKLWMAKAIEFGKHWDQISTSDKKNPYLEMQLTILRMLDLCTVCGKEHVYSTILKAVVEAGIEPPVLAAARPQFHIHLQVRILQDWSAAYSNTDQSQSLHAEKHPIKVFSEKLSSLAEDLGPKIILEPEPARMSFGLLSSEGLTSHVRASSQNEVIEQQRALIKKLQDEIALSSRTMEEERCRLAQVRQQDVQTAALYQEHIEALEQETKKLKLGQAEPEDDHSHKLEMIISQQGASIATIQEQINQLIQLVSQPPKTESSLDLGREGDSDSGYGSDTASDTIPSSPTWWTTSDGTSAIQAPMSEAEHDVGRTVTRDKPFYVQRLRLKASQKPGSSRSEEQQSQMQPPRPALSRAPLKTIVQPEPPGVDPTIPSTDSTPLIPPSGIEPRARLHRSQRLLLTSVADWLRWHRVANGRTGALCHRPLEDFFNLTHDDLVDYGIVIEETRNFMLKDIAVLRKLSPSQLEEARAEVTIADKPAVAESSPEIGATSEPISISSVLRNTFKSIGTSRAKAATLRSKARIASFPNQGWDISKLQEASPEFVDSWQDTAMHVPMARGKIGGGVSSGPKAKKEREKAEEK